MQKIYLAVFSISTFITGFYCGMAVQNRHNNIDKSHMTQSNKESKPFKTKFFSKAKKNIKNIKVNNRIIKLFHNEYENCLKQNLSSEESKILQDILEYVQKYQKEDDSYIEIEWENDDFLKDKIVLGKKIRKCKYNVFKKIKKEEKVEFYKNVKLMELDDIIKLFHGV